MLVTVLALGITSLSPAGADPLAGRIWVPAEARFAEPAEVLAAARHARYVLLGETHTITRHHVLQARLIRAISEVRRAPVVFEMIPRNRQPAIDEWRQATPPDPARFGDAVAWADRGWPPWPQYQPIVEAALAHDLPIRAGGPAEAMLGRVARGGLDALGSGHGLPGLDTPLARVGETRLLETLRRAHCGLPEHAPVARMIAVQRLRDAAMAGRLLESDAGDGAILVAGHGHVRRDYGVPVYLERADASGETLSIAFFGTAGEPTVEAQRAAAGGRLAFDYVWFTRGGERGPDCPPADADD